MSQPVCSQQSPRGFAPFPGASERAKRIKTSGISEPFFPRTLSPTANGSPQGPLSATEMNPGVSVMWASFHPTVTHLGQMQCSAPSCRSTEQKQYKPQSSVSPAPPAFLRERLTACQAERAELADCKAILAQPPHRMEPRGPWQPPSLLRVAVLRSDCGP